MILSGKTVVYGGSFNPPHVGHQTAGLYLLEALDAAEVWLVPAFRHPFGKELAPFSARAEMCALAIGAYSTRARVSRIEADSSASGRTYDTLVQLQEREPARSFALAVGSDVLRETTAWYRWDDIETLVPVVVLGRSGYPSTRATPVEMPAVSSGEIRRRVRQGFSIEGLVPAPVAAYIAQHGLYR